MPFVTNGVYLVDAAEKSRQSADSRHWSAMIEQEGLTSQKKSDIDHPRVPIIVTERHKTPNVGEKKEGHLPLSL
jgi:hypothetical protein